MQPLFVRVFISSTWLDLQPERQAVETALQRMRETKFIGMEYFGSHDESTRTVSLDEVDHSDIYIGISGGRYGSGITEAEYRRAHERGLPCFIYLKDEANIPADERETTPKKATRLRTLKEELRHSHTVTAFTNPDDLAAKVTADLHLWLFDKHLVPALEQASLLGDEAHVRCLIEAIRDEATLRTVLAQRGIAVGGDVAQSLLVTGNRNVINFLVQGIAALTTDYATRIQNFLVEYLGTPDRPVPFGGREADLARLNAWLGDPHSSPYLFLAAPAGRGKSALLTRWSRQLLTRRDVAVIFFPVSIRFRTNLAGVVFAALTARLATLHGDKVPGGPDTPVEVWRGLMTDYLNRPLSNGQRLLLIVDGVDEAADWEPGPDLFPLDPPKGLRIILSARYRAGDIDTAPWLRSLGWDRPGLTRVLDLAPLTREGVADVLLHMGFPLDKLGERVDIVAELHRLSEGDPLLVRLYVDDLWTKGEAAARLSAEDLRALRPGLKGYFDRWWDDQRRLWGKDKSPLHEPAVRALLNLLSCTLGRVNREEILRLAPPQVGLNTWVLEETLQPLARFIIGDGRQQGYVFSHPRLGSYFYDALTKQERQDWEARILALGEETLKALNERRFPPKEASPYVVQYYGAHLQRTNCTPEALLALVSNHWRQAWEELEGSYAGFLNDVDRAWQAAEQADRENIRSGCRTSYLGGAVRCALCHASVHSLAGNIPPTLLQSLVAKQVWAPDQGLTYALQVSDPQQRAEAIAKLGPYLSEPLLYEALEAVRKIEAKPPQVEALTSLVPYLPEKLKREVVGEALQATRAIKNEFLRMRELTRLTPHLPISLLQEALQVTQTIEDALSRTQALAGLVAHLSDEWRGKALYEALQTARIIEDEPDRAEALTTLAPFLPEALLREVLQMTQTIEDDTTRAEVLIGLAPYLSKILLQDALQATRTIKNKYDRMEAVGGLVPHLSEDLREHVLHEVLQEARAIHSEIAKAQPLTKLAPHLSGELKEHVLSEALQAARAIPLKYAYTKVEVLIELAPYLPEKTKKSVLHEALHIARAALGEDERAEMLTRLMPLLPEPLRQDALEIALAMKFEYHRAQALIGLAPHLPEPLLWEVLQAIQFIGDELSRTNVLRGLSPYLPEPLLQEALKIAQGVRDEVVLTEKLSNLARCLPKEPQEKVLSEVLHLAPVTKYEISTESLTESSHSLLNELPREAVREALYAARTIKNKTSRVIVLAELIPHLPADLQKEVLYEALRTVGTIIFPSELAKALKKLASLSPKSLQSEVLQMARAIKDDTIRIKVLGELVPYLSEKLKREISHEVLQKVQLEVLQKVQLTVHLWEPSRARTLATLVLHLPRSLLCEALKVVQTFESKSLKVVVWTNLIPRLSRKLKEEILNEALQTARTIEVDHIRVWTLMKLSPYFSETRKEEILREALQAAQSIENEFYRTQRLAELAPYLTQLPLVTLHSLWCQALRFSATRTHMALIADLHALSPILIAVGGAEAVVETIRITQDVRQWEL